MESDRFRKGKLNMKRPSTAADGLADPDLGASVQRGNGSVDEVE